MSKTPKSLDGRQKVLRGIAESAAVRGQHFFYVLIREPLSPLERGKVVGGGSQLGENNTIEFCGVDIVVNDRNLGLKVIRKCLRACGAGNNTVIEEYEPEFNELTI